jgi:hypothetical protein
MSNVRITDEAVRGPIDGTEAVLLATPATNWQATIANILTAGLAASFSTIYFGGSRYTGSGIGAQPVQLTLTGSLYGSVTNAANYIVFSPFDASNPSFVTAHTLTATWDSGAPTNQKGPTLSVLSTVNTGAPSTGSVGAVAGETLNKLEGSDAFGLLGVMANSNDVTNAAGAAIWGIIRRIGDKGFTTVDAIRATNEADGTGDGASATQHARAGLLVSNSASTNPFTNGVKVESALTYGMRVGLTTGEGAANSNVITPTHPFSFFDKTGTELFFVSNDGRVSAPFAAGYYFGAVQILWASNSQHNTNLADPAGAVAITLTDSTLNGNFYDNTDHVFRTRSGAAEQLRITGSQIKFQSAAIAVNGSVATALTSVGPTGSHTAVQEWLVIQNPSGTARYIPLF